MASATSIFRIKLCLYSLVVIWLAGTPLCWGTPSPLRFKTLPQPELDLVGGHWASAQDPQGFLWFAGEGGLARYDGYKVKRYQHDPDNPRSLSASYINDLLIDRDGELWVATKLGVNRYERATDDFARFRHFPQSLRLSSPSVSSLLEDKAGHLWFGTRQDGLIRFNPKNGQFNHYVHPNNDVTGAGHNHIATLFEDAQGGLWVGTRASGLSRLETQTNTFEHYRHNPVDHTSLSDDRVLSLQQDQQGWLWVGTADGLNRFNHDTKTFVHYWHDPDDPSSLSTNFIYQLFNDRDDSLWVAVRGGGLNRYNRTTNRFDRYHPLEGDADSLPSDTIRSIFQDKAGDMWFGHFPSGVSRLDRYATAFRNYQHNPYIANSLSHSSIMSVTEDQQGLLWIGTQNGLNSLNRRTGHITRYLHDPKSYTSLSGYIALAVLVDSHNTVWVGTWPGGLSRLNRETGDFTHYKPAMNRSNSLNSEYVWALYEDSQQRVWVGTENGGLNRYNRQSNDFTSYHQLSKGCVTVFAIYEDRRGNFWIGCGNGLDLMDRERDTFKHYQHIEDDPHSLSANHIWAITEDSSGHLWLGTHGGGVNKFNRDTGRFKAYRVKDGLADNSVTGILEDAQGYLWFSTGNGLSRFDPRTETFRHYDKRYGLPGNMFHRAAYLKTRAGELVFGSSKGLTVFEPSQIEQNTVAPAVVMTDFRILNKPVPIDPTGSMRIAISLAQTLTFNYQQSVFSLEFAALNYRMPDKNQYAYQLEGFDEQWMEAGFRRRVTYTNLDAGRYTFRVKASNNEGVWNEQGLSITIDILPPWWRTWWAYTLYTMAAVALLGWFIYTERRKLAYEREKVAYESEKVKHERAVVRRLQQVDKLKDEFLANTSHELRTPLYGIIGLTESLVDGAAGLPSALMKSNLEMIAQSGKRLRNLVNDILDFSKLKNESLVLSQTPVDLHSVVDVVMALTQPLVGAKALVLNNDIDEHLPLAFADENRLQQILYNLVGNAIKFTDRGAVSVSAQQVEDRLSICVADTGIGIEADKFDAIFESFEQIGGTNERVYGGTGLGLALTQKLVALHGGDISVASTLGQGATFTFTLEVAKETAPEPPEQEKALVSHTLTPIVALEEIPPRIDVDPQDYCPTDQSRFTLLVVDDEPVNRQVLRNHLSLQNYTVIEAGSGGEALAVIDSEQGLDLILLDIMMPCMSGFEVAKAIRERHSTHELPIIFLTAKNQVTDLVVAFHAGANDFISKPITKEELLARVNTHLELLEIHRTLEQQVFARTFELKQKHERLKQAQSQLVQSETMGSVGVLVAGMAHEINNPTNFAHANVYNLEHRLRGFEQYLYALAEEDGDGDIRRAFEKEFTELFSLLETIREGTTRLKTLIEDLHAFSTPSQEDVKEVNLGTALQRCIHLLKPIYRKQVAFELDIQSEMTFCCNSPQIHQAFMSIMTNACQAITATQASTTSAEPGTLNLALYEQQEQLVVSFEDTGCGMSEQTQQHMFDPFYTTKPEGEGTGLGMSITFGIIERLGGRMLVSSQEGEGTKISVHLPLAPLI